MAYIPTYEPLNFRKLYQPNTLAELLTLQAKAHNKMIVLLIQDANQFALQLKQSITLLAPDYAFVKFAVCDPENSITTKFNITKTPSIVLLKGKEYTLIEKDIYFRMCTSIEEYENTQKQMFDKEKEVQFPRIEKILSEKPLMLMIKGTATEPKCKFTRQLLDAVNAEKKDYGFYDILKDEPIRQWLKFYSDWYTFPQVYLNKKIVGGVDVMIKIIKEEKAKM